MSHYAVLKAQAVAFRTIAAINLPGPDPIKLFSAQIYAAKHEFKPLIGQELSHDVRLLIKMLSSFSVK